jgi:NAD(P)-dependent dehydrogenase (short-subunit alcohol dehydrogenase family)
MRFENKVAFITGGAVGFGRAFAKALSNEGASIIIADIDITAAKRTAKVLEEGGASALAVECDVADKLQVDNAISVSIDRFGGIDLLINNAAKHLSKYAQPFGNLPLDEIRALFDVNLMGVVHCSLSCRESMRSRGGGTIVNMSSIAAYMPSLPADVKRRNGLTLTSAYSVSKLAVKGLTVAFAVEFGSDNIRVNAIAPGRMDSEAAMADHSDQKVKLFTEELQLVARRGNMADVVSALLFLASDEASFITGETLKVSGGFPLTL